MIATDSELIDASAYLDLLLVIMCLPSVLVAPSERARRLADYLRVALVFHALLCLAFLLSVHLFEFIFDALVCGIGCIIIRSSEAYQLQQCLFYCVFTGVNWLLSTISLIALLFSSDATRSLNLPADASNTRFRIAVIAVTSAPLIYALCANVAYSLYKELKAEVDDMSQQLNAANDLEQPPQHAQPQRHWGAYSQPATGGSQYQPNANAAASGAPDGFRAFSGTGYKLDGN